ncbi:hypothetical protein [Methylobacterium aquaticum]|uniref:hypothetical protein n=1 Tax=Methylobacterium aquaticum TaxID=270351 RepID=UPI0019332199|nr:hypothetical protein [Methylobacterium aquaticum]QRE72945.1 hypothetical protein F1D61_04000 [Methylobacterium aquaticum]
MVSVTLALLTVLLARRALVPDVVALLASPAKSSPAPLHSMAAAPILDLPAPAAVADPILSAIRAHRRALALFQIAPDDAAAAADEAEHEASMRLLGTACASRAGAHALIAHLRWYVAEEGTNVLTSGIGGCERGDLVRARLAELVLFVPEASPPAVIALPSAKELSPLLAATEFRSSPTSSSTRVPARWKGRRSSGTLCQYFLIRSTPS